MKQESINSLQDDLKLLIEKHHYFITRNEFGQALNVMKNIDILSSQLKSIGYKELVSKYTLTHENGKDIDPIKLITIWKQNSFGNTKDIETYRLGEKYEATFDNILDNITNNWNTMSKEIKDNICSFIAGEKDENVITPIVNEQSKLDNDNKWYNILKYFIETEQSQLIKIDHINRENHRGTGKTTAILRLSNDYNIPIITCIPNESELRSKAKELGLNAIIEKDISNIKNKLVLIDENTNSRFIGSKIITIGFSCIYDK